MNIYFLKKQKNTKKIFLVSILIVSIFLSLVNYSQAVFNKEINYQGKLTTSAGVAVSNGTYNMEFKIYNAGGTNLWTETRTTSNRVQVTSGLFSVMLGEVTSLSGVDFNQTLYLGVNIGGTAVSPSWDGEMSPRKKLGTVPAALVSESVLNGVYTNTSNTFTQINPLITPVESWIGPSSTDGIYFKGNNVGVGTVTPGTYSKLDVGGTTQINGSIYPFVGITNTADSIQALQMQNKSTGVNAEMRFISAANDGSYVAFTQPSTANTGTFFGATKSTGSFIFNAANSATARDLYIGTTDAKSFNIGTNNLNRMTVLSGGNVGIGTTTPALLLDVLGRGVFGSKATSRNSYGNTLTLANEINTDTSLFLWQNGIASAHLGFSSGSNVLRIVNATSDGLISGTTGMFITNTGNVGIGQTSPTAVLHLKAGTASANTAPLKLTAGTNLTTAEAGAMEWDGTNLFITQTTGPTRKTIAYTSDLTGGYVPYTGATGNVTLGTYSLTSPLFIGGTSTTQSLSFKTTTGVGATGADMHFLVGNNGATEAMTVLNNGNIGMGITAPLFKLDVTGNARFSDTVTVNNGVKYSNATATYFENIALQNNGSIPNGYIKFVTPIRTAHNQMFSIDITGYDYNVGKSIDFTVTGYAYAAGDAVINIGFSNRSSFSRQVRATLEDRGAGYRVLVITLGTSDGSGNCNDAWYYQKFGATVRLWSGSHSTFTANEFTWVNGETSLAAGYWQGAQINNQVLDGQLGTISTLGNITSTAGLLSMSGSGNNYLAGNLGIGTATPGDKLTVSGGSIAIYNGSWLRMNGASSGQGLTYDGVSNSLRLVPGNGGVSIRNGSNTSDLVSFLASGNVGIGTTSPGDILQLGAGGAGTARAALSFTNGGYSASPSSASAQADGDKIILYNNSVGKVAIGLGNAYDMWLQSNGNASSGIRFMTGTGTSASEAMRVSASGNVGIGTTSPGAKLQISGGDIYSWNNAGNPRFLFGDSASGGDYGGLRWDSTGDYISLYTDTAGTNQLVLKEDGNIGIGTASPNSKLHISQPTTGVGSVSVSGTAVTGVGTQFTNTFKVGDTITVTTTSGSETKAITTITSDTVLVTDAFAGTAVAGTSYTLTGGDRFVVKGNGNVGIGITTPTSKLSIASNFISSGLDIKQTTSVAGTYNLLKLGIDDWSLANRGLRFQNWTDLSSARQYLLYNGYVTGTTPDFYQGNYERFSGIEFKGGDTNFLVNTGATGAGANTLITPTSALSIKYTGNVGIGQTSPTAVLHLKAGTASANTAPLKLTAGTNLTTAEAGAMEWDGTNLFITQTTGPTRKTIAYTSDLTGGYIPYTGGTSNVDLGIHNLTVDTNSLFVDSVNHRVGIGTLTPSSKLEINGTYLTEFNTTTNGSYGMRTSGPVKANEFYLYNSSGGFRAASGAYMFYADTAGRFATGSNTLLSGLYNVVQSTTGNGTVATTGTTTLTGSNTSFLSTFKVGDTVTVSGETVRTISTITSDTVLNVSVAFSNTASGLSYTLTGGNRFSVMGNGNVGIGTTAPAYKLDVYGDSKFGGSVSVARYSSFDTSGRLVINYNDNVSIPVNFVNLRNLDTTAGITHLNKINFGFARTADATERGGGGLSFGKEQEWTSTSSTNDSYFAVETSLDSTVSEKLRITSAGNVGIGITAPNQQLEITKNFRLPDTTYNSGNQYGVIYKGAKPFIHNFNYGLNGGAITTEGSNIFIGTDVGNFTMGSTATSAFQSSYNTIIGTLSFTANTTGYSNTAHGYGTLLSNTTGAYNNAMGNSVLANNTTGSSNNGQGFQAMRFNTTGSNNTAIGTTALNFNTTGSYNVAIGQDAGRYLADGSSQLSVSSNSLFLGSATKASANNSTNEIVIGYNAIGNGDNSATLGNDSITKTILKGNVGIGTTSPTAVLHLKAGTASANTAPLKLTAGTNLTTAEAGAMEWDGTNLFITQTTGPTRKTIAYTSDLTGGYIPYTGGTSNVDLGVHNLTVDTNSLFVDSVNHRVGVGTTSPQSKFSLVDSNTTNSSYNSINFSHTDSGGMNSSQTKNGLKVNSAFSGTYSSPVGTSMEINSIYGISNFSGVISSGNSDSLYQRGIKGDAIFSGTASSSTENVRVIGGEFTSSGNIGTTANTSHYGVKINVTGTADYNYGLYVDNVINGTNNYSAIFNGGNVGIGITTPTAKLNILGDNGVSGNAPEVLRVTGGDGATGPYAGGGIALVGGSGGSTSSSGGNNGGLITLTGGNGGNGSVGPDSGGNGGNININGGLGGTYGYSGYVNIGTIQGGVVIGANTNTYMSLSSGINSGFGVTSSNTTNNVFSISGNYITSAALLNLQSSGTGAINNQKGLNISLAGTNATSAQTTYGAYISNTHAGTTSTNVGLYVTASGGTTANYAAIFAAGNVGIGQTSPTAVLHLKAGTASANTAPLKLTAGTNLTTAEAGAMEWDGTNLFITQTTGPTRKTIAYTSDLTGGYIPYTGGTSNVDLGVHNLTVDTNSLFVDSVNHRVGVGTITPGALLEVAGDTYVSGKLGIGALAGSYSLNVEKPTAYVNFKSTVGTNYALFKLNNTGGDFYIGRENSAGTGLTGTTVPAYSAILNAQGTAPLIFVTNNAPAMTILNGGNVGIGTTSPTGTLDISSGKDIGLVLGADNGANTRTDATNKFGRMYIPHYTNAEQPVSVFVGSSNVSDNTIQFGGGTSAGNSATVLSFFTAADNITTTGTERMRINSAGNVGIGTNNPGQILDISKSSSGGIGAILNLSNLATTALNNAVELRFAPSDSGAVRYSSIQGINNGSNGISLAFVTGAGSVITEKMRLDPYGALGLGTTAPGYKLDVFGGAATDGVRSTGGFDVNLVSAPTAPTYTLSAGGSVDAGVHYYFVTYTTAVGQTSAGSLLTSVVTAGNNTVNLTIPVSTDTRVTGRKIYRTKVGGTSDNEYLLATIADNTSTTYVDTTADSSLTGQALQYYRVNSTSKYISINGTQGMIIDTNLVALGKNAGLSLLGNYAPVRTVLVGPGAGQNITTGTANVVLGVTGTSLTTGGSNTLLGDLAGALINTGSSNVVIGGQAGRYITTNSNTVIGAEAGKYLNDGTTQLTAPTYSTYLGYGARGSAANESNAIVIGYNALGLGSNTVVLGNSSITKTALFGNVGIGTTVPTAVLHLKAGTASANTAPLKLTAGTNLTTAEAGAMEWDGTNLFITQTTGPTRKTIAYTSDLTGGYIPYTGGTSNVDLGLHDLTVDTNSLFVDSVNHRVGIGTTIPAYTLDVNGDINVANGSAYKYNGENVIRAQTSNGNYFFGNSGNLTMTGLQIVSIGLNSLLNNTTGSYNTASGYSALSSNTTGYQNTANGNSALSSNTTGYQNIATGGRSLHKNTTGYQNTANGFEALYSNTTGSKNIGIGYKALYNLNIIANDGSGNNTAIGYNTGLGIVTGVNNTIIGANVTGLSSSLSNNIIIADGAGNQRINVLSDGNVGIGQTSPTAVLHLKAGTASANTAPLKLTAGTNLTTAEAGAMEWDGTNLFITQTTGPTRKTIAYTSDLTGGYIPYTGGTSNVDLGIHNLTVDTNSLFVDSVNHYVGIGNITPSAKLHVAGDVKVESLHPIVDLIDSNGADWKISLEDNHLSFLGNNGITEYVRFNNGGNVGFGTSAPTSILALGGTAARTIQMERNTTAATAGQGLTLSSGGAIAGTADLAGGDLTLKSGISTGTGTSALRFFTATGSTTGTTDNTPTEKMTILGNGNVGIGNVVPTGALDVWGNAYEDNIPAMISLSTPSPYVASSSTTYGSPYFAYMAFNKVRSQYGWIALSGTTTGWLKLDVGSGTPKTISAYTVTAVHSTYITAVPKNWTFEGSNDDSNWTTLDTQTNVTSWSYNETKRFLIATPGSYRYYRINVSANNGHTTYLMISQLRLLESGIKQRLLTSDIGTFIVQGAPGTWEKLQSWRNTSGTELASIDTSGSYVSSGSLTINNSAAISNGLAVGSTTIARTYTLEAIGGIASNGIRSWMGFDIYQVPNPIAPTMTAGSGGSVDAGAHWYGVTYTTPAGETNITYSAAQITVVGGTQTVTVTVPVSTDGRVTGRKIYRTKAGEQQYQEYLLATIADNSTATYVDTTADSALSGSSGLAYFRTNTTSKNITVGGTGAVALDRNLTALGLRAGEAITTGGRNAFFGYIAGYLNTSGTDNTGFGHNAMGVTTGSSNSGFGSYSMRALTIGNSNVGYGAYSGFSLTQGSQNTAVGVNSLYSNITSSNNTAIGYQALFSTTGQNNTAIGHNAGYAGVAVSNNTFLGYYAGRYETGGSKLIIDSLNRVDEATSRSAALIYGVVDATPANQILALGGGGKVGIGTIAPAEKLSIGYGANTDFALGSLTNNKVFLGTYNDNAVFAINRRVSDGVFANSNLPTASFGFYTSNNNSYISFNTSNANGSLDSERMRIDKDGNVGIGTSSPTNLLSLGGTAARTIWMQRNTTAATAGQGLTLSSGGTTLGTTNLAGGDLNLKSGISTGTGTSALRFFTATAGTTGTTDNAPTEKMTILGSGNVGIGVITPTSVLHLKAGTASVNTAPLKLTAGINLTTPETGAMEYDGTDLYFTPSGTTRETFAYISDLTAGYVPYSGGTTDVDLGIHNFTVDGEVFLVDSVNHLVSVGTPPQTYDEKRGFLSVDGNLVSSLKGGSYFGRVGLTENQWKISEAGANWTQSNSSTLDWTGVAMSSDGKIQTAVASGDYIYYSLDYGVTWTQSNSSTSSWTSVAMSSDGKIQTAVTSTDKIFISNDYGVNWNSTSSTSLLWAGVAMSGDGKIQTAVANDDYIHYSIDYGATWVQAGSSILDWKSVAISSDGKIQTAVASGDYIYYSKDYGVTWTQSNSISSTWKSVAVSSDGKIQSAVASGDYIYYSLDYGVTWTQSASGSLSWTSVAMSGDGKIQSAGVSGNNQTYYSTDYGTNWLHSNSNGSIWTSVAMSSDGKIQTGVTNSDYIYYSNANSYTQGNIGIGTTSPTSILALSGVAARTIQMERNTTAATAGQGLTLSSGGAIAGTADLAGGDLNLKSGISTGTGTSALRFFTATAGSTGTTDNTPTEKMTILGSGNVGIGVTNPLSIFHIAQTQGDIKVKDLSGMFGGASDTGIVFNGGGSMESALLTEVNGTLLSYAINVPQVTTRNETLVGGIFRIDTRASQQKLSVLGYATGGSVGLERFSANIQNGNVLMAHNGGSVGVGTTSPTNLLSLGGTAARTIWMERNTTAATAGQGLTLSSGGAIAGTANLAGGDLNIKSGISTGTGTSSLRFFTATAGSTGTTDNTPTEKMTILGSGYVGIGIATPGTKLEIGSSDLGDGVAGPVITLGRNTNATNTGAGSINFLKKDGTAGYVWQDAAGNMRINTAAPTNANDTAGTVIGAQTSTRETKQDILEYTDYSEALDMIINAPLHTFRYINEVSGYGSTSPLAKTRIGFIADEVSSAFMVGNTIDQVSINGLLMASVKELNLKIKNIESKMSIEDVPSSLSDYADLFFDDVVEKVENGIVYMKGIATGSLKVGSREKRTGITLFDEVTGDPYCLSVANGMQKTVAGECAIIFVDSISANAVDSQNNTGDSNGNSDDIAPVIVLNGSSTVNLNIGSQYNEEFATATDNVDGSVAIVVSGLVDTTTAGIYTVSYNAMDTAGNNAIEVIRTINVGNVENNTNENTGNSESNNDNNSGNENTETVDNITNAPSETIEVVPDPSTETIDLSNQNDELTPIIDTLIPTE